MLRGMARVRRRGTLLAAVALALVAVGCTSAPAQAPPASTASTGAPGAASSTSVPPGQVRISGAVRQPGMLTADQLAGLPSQTVAVTFGSDKGDERHTETGVSLFTVIDRAGLALTPGKKHDEVSTGVLVIGSDGYQALVSYGEMAPRLGNRGVLLATAQDGVPLERPRLVVPGDAQGARYVNGVVELRVLHSTPGA